MTAGAIKAGSAFVELGVKDLLDRHLKRALAKLRGFGASLESIGKKLAAIGAAAGAPFLAAIQAGSNMEEVMNKFSVVFGDSAADMQKWGDEFGKQIGMSKRQVRDFLSQAQDTFVPLGFDPAEARETSKVITTLAADLASFNNMSQDEAFERLMGAMVGNTENLLRFGVVAQQAQIKAEALAMGFDPKNLTAQQKAAAVLNITLKGTAAAHGDAARSTGTFTGQMKILKASAENAAASIGAGLLPSVTGLLARISEVGEKVSAWIEKNGELFRNIAIGAAKVTALGIAIMAVGKIVALVAAGFAAVTAAVSTFIAIVSAPIGLAALAGVGAAAWALRDAFSAVGEQGSKSLGEIKRLISEGNLAGAFQVAAEAIRGIWNILMVDLKVAWQQFVDESKAYGADLFSFMENGDRLRKASRADAATQKDLARQQAKRNLEAKIEEVRKAAEVEEELSKRRGGGSDKAGGGVDLAPSVTAAAAEIGRASHAIAGTLSRGSVATAQKAFENTRSQEAKVVNAIKGLGAKVDKVARAVEKGGVVAVV